MVAFLLLLRMVIVLTLLRVPFFLTGRRRVVDLAAQILVPLLIRLVMMVIVVTFLISRLIKNWVLGVPLVPLMTRVGLPR